MKKKTGLLILILILALLAIGGGIFWAVKSSKGSNKEVLVNAVKSKASSIKKSLIKDDSPFKDKIMNLNLNLEADGEEFNVDAYFKGEEFYLKANNKDEGGELVYKDNKLYIKDIGEKEFYYMDLGKDVATFEDSGIDKLFEDVKEEDVKKEKTEITINGKEYKVEKLSYEFTKEQLQKIAKEIGDTSLSEEELKNFGTLTFETYVYQEEIIKTVFGLNIEGEQVKLVLEEISKEKEGYYSLYVMAGAMKFVEAKAVEKEVGIYDISFAVPIMNLHIAGEVTIKDNDIKAKLASSNGAFGLDLIIDSITEVEKDLKLTLKMEEESITLNGKIKEVNKMPDYDISNSKPLDDKEPAEKDLV